jgi:hypothetical protein
MKFFLCFLFFTGAAFGSTPDVIPPAKHLVGYACLKEIQNNECWMPFKSFDKEGNILPMRTPIPDWAKSLNEDTPKDMVDYDGYGFKVISMTKDRIELQTPAGTTWIPKGKLQKFYPLEDVPFCEFSDKEWASNLYKADLKTLEKVSSTKTSAGIEVLEKKWVTGQLWFKVKVFEGDSLGESESQPLGSFWVPFSKNITICPKGC